MKDRFHRHYPAEGWPLYWLLFGYTSNRIILDRSSYDFGKPKWHLLDDDAIDNLCSQFPLPADYDGVGSKGTKFVFYQ